MVTHARRFFAAVISVVVSLSIPVVRAGAEPPLVKGDVAALVVGTSDGVDVLVPAGASPPASADGWRVLTSLWVEGWDAPAWTEYHCLTGDGRFLAVTFAPATFADREDRRAAGAFAAVVDLSSGSRWIVPERVALAYHSPGCGTGDVVVFSRRAVGDDAGTELIRVDAAARRVIDTRTVAADVSSAVPAGTGVAAAAGRALVDIATDGAVRRLTTAPGAIFDVRPGRSGAVEFVAVTGAATSAAYRRAAGGRVERLATGPLRNLRLRGGRAGANHLVGAPAAVLPGAVIDIVRTSSEVLDSSLDGSLLVLGQAVPGVTASGRTGLPTGATVTVRARASGAARTMPVLPATAPSGPALRTSPPSGTRVAAVTTSPCAVPRLDPGTQILQPTPEQVEWAANQAVRGRLTLTREAGWQKHGLPAYSPAALFPRPGLAGSPGAHIPVQVVEGVLAQESNFSQASWHALVGVPGDPLVGNYYGVVYDADGNILDVNYADADCGYGVGQITTHMTTADTTWSATQKRAVATDYAVNVAATVVFLETFWNQLKSAGVIVNDANPEKIENWFPVLWAYNSGVQPNGTYNPAGCVPGPACTYQGRWGLGWTNNPAQNDYLPTRAPFLQTSYDDAAHPANWPYQEKVLGWARYGQLDLQDGGKKFLNAPTIKPPTNYYLFCTAVNNCSQTSAGTGYCLSSDRTTCWWHGTAIWSNPGTPEDASAYSASATQSPLDQYTPYPPSCKASDSPVVQMPGTTALPSGAVVVDDLPSSATNLVGCATAATSGSFSLTYGTGASGLAVGQIDTHQIGVGYAGHVYFSHTVEKTRKPVLVTGRWTPPSSVTGWRHVWVHIPDNGATTFQADYQISTGSKTYHRVVNQRWNQNSWLDLGSFNLGAGSYVSLSNATWRDHLLGTADVAWDAVAFTPSAKPAVSMVAMGDSYSSGEGLEPYYPDSDNGASTPGHVNACHRSPQAYGPRVFADLRAKHPGANEFHFVACSGATTDKVLAASQSGEVPQLQTGWLDENTTHVTISIGGNDAKFADIISFCIVAEVINNQVLRCDSPLTILPGDTQPLTQREPARINSLGAADGPLRRIYAQIKAQAPNAQVIVLGYPIVVAPGQHRTDPACLLLDDAELSAFKSWGDLMATVLGTTTAAAGVTYVDPRAIFRGPPPHEACSQNIADEWINATINWSDSGSGHKVPGTGSFHPKPIGHSAEAALIKPTLR